MIYFSSAGIVVVVNGEFVTGMIVIVIVVLVCLILKLYVMHMLKNNDFHDPTLIYH